DVHDELCLIRDAASQCLARATASEGRGLCRVGRASACGVLLSLLLRVLAAMFRASSSPKSGRPHGRWAKDADADALVDVGCGQPFSQADRGGLGERVGAGVEDREWA